jgi:hypothetical protein
MPAVSFHCFFGNVDLREKRRTQPISILMQYDDR